MNTGRVSGTDWDEALGVHNLFTKVIDSLIKNYREITPVEVIEFILKHPSGTECDGMATVYATAGEKGKYSIRTQYVDGELTHNTDLKTMLTGSGGFIAEGTTLVEPKLFPDITELITKDDIKVVPWLGKMGTALVIPTISVSGEPATTMLFACEKDGFDGKAVKHNIFITYSITIMILSWLHRMDSVKAWAELDKELENVGKVQKGLLPKSAPQSGSLEWATHYSTSTRAGGDYYDFFELPDDRTGAIIADVSGHGSPAAVMMAMMRLLLHTYSGGVDKPEEVLLNLNKLLTGNMLPGQFITAFFCVLDSVNDRGKTKICYSNAGHHPPYLYSAASGKVTQLEFKGGLPLAITPQATFCLSEAELSSGDALFFYTDGVTEAMNDKKEMYGDDRIKDVLGRMAKKGVEAVKEELLKDLDIFCNG